jgi:hypothetical protein
MVSIFISFLVFSPSSIRIFQTLSEGDEDLDLEGVQSILQDGGLDRGGEVLETGKQDVAP